MEEIFKNIFAKHNLTDDQLRRFISDYTTGLVVSLIVSAPNVSTDDEERLEDMIHSQNLEGIIQLLETKFESKEAWTKYLTDQAVPLFDNYVKTVAS